MNLTTPVPYGGLLSTPLSQGDFSGEIFVFLQRAVLVPCGHGARELRPDPSNPPDPCITAMVFKLEYLPSPFMIPLEHHCVALPILYSTGCPC